ncbi:MAG: hypothetical protein GWN58_51910 [Anaerolineae bacterium]|nr:hypothetical protein [Anaerolineae bacterium]
MGEPGCEITVGILGQWASGKTEAARTLIGHLGGPGKVTFLSDRELFFRQAHEYFLGLDESQVTTVLEADGSRRLQSEQAALWLGPGEDLRSVNLSSLRFYPDDETSASWLAASRRELGERIRVRCEEDKPVVIEVAFGPDVRDLGGGPLRLTVADFFCGLEDAGLEAEQIKWIIVEAGYKVRSRRNDRQGAHVPVDIFDRFAGDGGDLTPEQQKEWEKRGMILRRVSNDHEDIERFRSDIIAAFEEITGVG